MIEHIPFETLGHANHGWLDARHHFSFANYYNPARMGVGPLMVWNDDTIQPQSGFPMHPHRDMEIITYVRTGQIDHQDHLGNRGTTKAGDVQVMSAGTGIMHAEYNLGSEPTTLFQIWIRPKAGGIPPRWDQREFPSGHNADKLVPLASGQDQAIKDGALYIHQEATLYGATLSAGSNITHTLGHDRIGYLVVARGQVTLADGTALGPRDGAVMREEDAVSLTATQESEIVLADIPASG